MNKPNYDIIYRFFTRTIIPLPSINLISRRNLSTSTDAITKIGLRFWTVGSGRKEFRSNKGVLMRGTKVDQTRMKLHDIGTERFRDIRDSKKILVLPSTRSYSSSTSKCLDPDCPHEPVSSNITSSSNAFTSNIPPPLSSQLSSLPSPPKLTSLPAPSSLSKIQLPHPTYLNSLPLSIRRLAIALPSPAGKPPSRDQLLALTTSFFDRLQIYFKWFTIRSYRRFRLDDYSAFASVGIMGTLGWFVISTTSFMAFCFFIVNSLSLQEWLAGKLGSYLTKSTGVRVVFESAIVPKWGLTGGGSSILFKNVYISRGPETAELGGLPSVVGTGDEEEETEEQAEERERMAKWTHFHMSIDTVEVSLSIGRWLDGKGLVKEATVTGVRGVVDRSHIKYDPKAPLDRFAYRHEAHPGDFELENLQVEDFLVTVYQPDHFRPYTFSIFNADIRKLRKQWLFYDLLSADSITGQVDNCLFSLHKPQSIGRTSEEDLKDVQWARMSRFRIDGVPIDHMQSAHDTGVLSWVTSGRCDLVADIRFPVSENSLDLSAIVADIIDKVDKEINTHLQPSENKLDGNRGKRIPGQRILAKGASLEVPKGWIGAAGEKEKVRKGSVVLKDADITEVKEGVVVEKKKEVEEDADEKVISIDLDLRFKDLKASVPFFTSDLTYVNNALIRPIVAFINSNRTLIPIHCHIDLPLSEFDGSWTTYDVGLLEKMSEQTYAALAHHVQNTNQQRFQRVSLWTIQLTANAVLSAFKNNLDTY